MVKQIKDILKVPSLPECVLIGQCNEIYRVAPFPLFSFNISEVCKNAKYKIQKTERKSSLNVNKAVKTYRHSMYFFWVGSIYDVTPPYQCQRPVVSL